jgi:phosphonopyruvate decarboxylase
MGHAISIAIGLAESSKGPTLVVDGDGAVVMRLMGLAFAGSRKPSNLCHVIFDNYRNDSTGGQPTLSPGMDLCGVAAACGYQTTRSVNSLGELEATISHFDPRSGPMFIRVPIATSGSRPPRIKVH